MNWNQNLHVVDMEWYLVNITYCVNFKVEKNDGGVKVCANMEIKELE